MKAYFGNKQGKKRKKQPECLAENCHTTTKHESGYCWDHRSACLKCGKRLAGHGIHCVHCAPRFQSVAGRNHAVNVQSRVTSQISEVKDMIRCYEDSWLAGKLADLCQLRLPVLRAQLKQMEQENVRSNRNNRKEVTHATPDIR